MTVQNLSDSVRNSKFLSSPGLIFASTDFGYALQCSLNKIKREKMLKEKKQRKLFDNSQLPVLFVLTILNHKGFNGIRLNDKYSLFGHEGQVILEEKYRAYLLDVQLKYSELARRNIVLVHLYCDD